MVLFPKGLHALKQVAKKVGLDLRGAYLNLDGGFDSAHNRKCIFGTFHDRAKVVDSFPGYTSGIAGCRHNLSV